MRFRIKSKLINVLIYSSCSTFFFYISWVSIFFVLGVKFLIGFNVALICLLAFFVTTVKNVIFRIVEVFLCWGRKNISMNTLILHWLHARNLVHEANQKLRNITTFHFFVTIYIKLWWQKNTGLSWLKDERSWHD